MMNSLNDTNIILQEMDDGTNIHLKVNKEDYELNIILEKNELEYILKHIKSAIWHKRDSIKMGYCAGANVFWNYTPEVDKISILIGQDDESWAIGFLLPFEVMAQIKTAIDGL